MSIIQGNALEGVVVAPARKDIERSLRFNSSDDAYLTRTLGSAGNRKTWTWSSWIKLGRLANAFENQDTIYNSYTDDNNRSSINIQDNAENKLDFFSMTGGSVTARLTTTQCFRDFSAWYHVIIAVDTTQATSTNRLKMYVNGVQVTSFSTATYPSQNADLQINTASAHDIGASRFSGSVGPYYYDGYMAEVHFIDGTALTPSSFGQFNSTTGVWEPIAYTGSYGTQGWYLPFSDNSSTTTLGDDFSGNNNDWTTNNFSVTAGQGNDSLVDTPTPYGTDTGAGNEVRGNYCTLNQLQLYVGTPINGNLNMDASNAGGYGTFGVTSGKWYWETVYTSISTDEGSLIGIRSYEAINGGAEDAIGYWGGGTESGNKLVAGVASAYGAGWTTNDVMGVALDLDGGSITFYKNNSSQGAISFTPGGKSWTSFNWRTGTPSGNNTFSMNYGQRPFTYTAPAGHKCLCSQNLPTPSVVKGAEYFSPVLYTGTGSSQSITGLEFQPDLVWIKSRSATTDHGLYDAARGVQQQLESNTTTDETTESTGLTAFGSDGFTVGSLAQLNTSAATYVAWCWKEGVTPGFDIVTYTGNGTARTISHNLGVVPNMIIVKARTTASTDQGWPIYHSANTSAPATDYLLLNSTAGTVDLNTVWNDTAPTSSVFSVGTNALVNANNDTYVAYIFANVAGYSAFGRYTGNGSSTGPFIFTNFLPAYVLFMRTDTTGGASMADATRDPFNVAGQMLYAYGTDVEGTNPYCDFVSNGFKVRGTSLFMNANGGAYIYAAFAENPFKYALAR